MARPQRYALHCSAAGLTAATGCLHSRASLCFQAAFEMTMRRKSSRSKPRCVRPGTVALLDERRRASDLYVEDEGMQIRPRASCQVENDEQQLSANCFSLKAAPT